MTAQQAVDNALGFPKIIKRSHGKDMIRTSAKLFEKGEVQVNGIRELNPERQVQSGDHIRWGMVRYGHKNCLVVR